MSDNKTNENTRKTKKEKFMKERLESIKSFV